MIAGGKANTWQRGCRGQACRLASHFELRWHFEAVAQHKGKTQIRHCEAEPGEVGDSVLVLSCM